MLLQTILDLKRVLMVGVCGPVKRLLCKFSSTLWCPFHSESSSSPRQAWQSVRTFAIIISFINQSIFYYLLSAAFGSENDSPAELGSWELLVLPSSAGSNDIMQNIYLSFRITLFRLHSFFLILPVDTWGSWSWLIRKLNWMFDVRF